MENEKTTFELVTEAVGTANDSLEGLMSKIEYLKGMEKHIGPATIKELIIMLDDTIGNLTSALNMMEKYKQKAVSCMDKLLNL